MVRDGFLYVSRIGSSIRMGRTLQQSWRCMPLPQTGRQVGIKTVQREKDGHRKSRDRLTFLVARPGGFEPPAKSLEGSCSIHLSYERVLSL